MNVDKLFDGVEKAQKSIKNISRGIVILRLIVTVIIGFSLIIAGVGVIQQFSKFKEEAVVTITSIEEINHTDKVTIEYGYYVDDEYYTQYEVADNADEYSVGDTFVIKYNEEDPMDVMPTGDNPLKLIRYLGIGLIFAGVIVILVGGLWLKNSLISVFNDVLYSDKSTDNL